MLWSHVPQAIPREAVGRTMRLLEPSMTDPAGELGPAFSSTHSPVSFLAAQASSSRSAFFARPISVAAFYDDIGHMSNPNPVAWIHADFYYHPGLPADGYSRFGEHLFRLSSAHN